MFNCWHLDSFMTAEFFFFCMKYFFTFFVFLYYVAVQVCPHAKGVNVKTACTFLYKIKFKNISLERKN